MEYIVSFLEGIITFISPCLLPMLPIYISYFMGGKEDEDKNKALKNSLGFVLGFTIVFVALGAFAGSIGLLLQEYKTAINIVTGMIVIVFGLNFVGIVKINFLNRTYKKNAKIDKLNFFSSMVFGIIFSIGWTPCVGAFLGSALMLASAQGSVSKGILMLVFYSLGLGIPFVASAVLIDRLKSTFDFVKRNYKIINIICGSILIIVGILMMTGLMEYFLSLVSF
ncbi:MAG: cytochrome c biogenesis protein CcdA [Oscillospiraceae bacterium]